MFFFSNLSKNNCRSNSPPPTPTSCESVSELPPLISQETSARSNLRRNSISLPALNNIDLEAIQKLNQISKEVIE